MLNPATRANLCWHRLNCSRSVHYDFMRGKVIRIVNLNSSNFSGLSASIKGNRRNGFREDGPRTAETLMNPVPLHLVVNSCIAVLRWCWKTLIGIAEGVNFEQTVFWPFWISSNLWTIDLTNRIKLRMQVQLLQLQTSRDFKGLKSWRQIANSVIGRRSQSWVILIFEV